MFFTVGLPVRNFAWESHHSIVNPGQGTRVLAKEILMHLGLQIGSQTFDTFDEQRKRASVTLRQHHDWHNNSELIYLRFDLLERYLAETKQDLVWVIWGGREYRPSDRVERDDEIAGNPNARKEFTELVCLRESRQAKNI